MPTGEELATAPYEKRIPSVFRVQGSMRKTYTLRLEGLGFRVQDSMRKK